MILKSRGFPETSAIFAATNRRTKCREAAYKRGSWRRHWAVGMSRDLLLGVDTLVCLAPFFVLIPQLIYVLILTDLWLIVAIYS